MENNAGSNESTSVSTKDRAEILHRLADAISEVTTNGPFNSRTNSRGRPSQIRSSYGISPEDRKKRDLAKKKWIENTNARLTELKNALKAARLYLDEDDVVYLNRAIRRLPEIKQDTRIEFDEDTPDLLEDIKTRLQFRADREIVAPSRAPEEVEFIAQGKHFAIGNDYRSLLDKDQPCTYKKIPAMATAALRAFHNHALGYDRRKQLDELRKLDEGLGSYTGRQSVAGWLEFLNKTRRDVLIHREAGKYWMEL